MPTTTLIARAAAILPLLILFPAGAAGPFVPDAAQRQRIRNAIPAEAVAKPAKARRLLVFNRNLEYNGHRPAILAASEAFTQMGGESGAFETTVSEDPAVFDRESLRQFDAVFFNNTIGACVAEPERRQNLLDFVTSGGGLMGVHGTSIAFMQWKWLA